MFNMYISQGKEEARKRLFGTSRPAFLKTVSKKEFNFKTENQ